MPAIGTIEPDRLAMATWSATQAWCGGWPVLVSSASLFGSEPLIEVDLLAADLLDQPLHRHPKPSLIAFLALFASPVSPSATGTVNRDMQIQAARTLGPRA